MTTKEAMELIGCKSRSTLYAYRNKGLLRCNQAYRGQVNWYDEDIYTLIGKRLYRTERKTVAYFRVNNKRYKNKLKEQIDRVKTFCQKSGIVVDDTYADYGKGTDYSESGRPEFHRLLQDMFRRQISVIIIDHKSRLTTFQWGIIETFCRYYGVTVKAISQAWDDDHYYKETTEDIADILVQMKVGSLSELADKTGDYSTGWNDVVDLSHRTYDDANYDD